MVSVLILSAVDHEFEPLWGQTKDYKIGSCCFSASLSIFKEKEQNWLARNQDNVSEWSDMSIWWMLFLWASTIKIHFDLVVVQSRHHHRLIEYNMLSPLYSWKIAYRQESMTQYYFNSGGCSLHFIQPETIFRKVTDDFGRELSVHKHFVVLLRYGSVVIRL
jgi:hypothetical protein